MDISSWIKTARKRGYSENEITSMLKKRGYHDDHIDSLLTDKFNFRPYILLSLVLIVLITAVVIFINMNKLPEIEDPEFQDCLSILSYTDRFECIISYAKENENFDACLYIPVGFETTQDECLLQTAVATGDSKNCPAAFNNIDDCYYRIAIQSGSPEVCRKIKGSDLLKNDCLSRLAEAEKTSYICEDDVCFLNSAVEEKNPKICEKADDKEYCLFSYALSLYDEEVCNQLSEKRRDACFMTIALYKKDMSLCELLPEEKKNSCELNIARASGDPALCDEITLRDQCLELLDLQNSTTS